jgi:single-strand DNA-binding protein
MSNFNFNKVILGGRLTADPELKTTSAGVSVTSFNLAVNRQYKTKEGEAQTDFITCVAWRNTAEFICKYFRKASSICVVGHIETRSWTDQQNVKRYATEVHVDEAFFVDAKGDSAGQASAGQAAPAPVSTIPPGPPQFEEIRSDEELPF